MHLASLLFAALLAPQSPEDSHLADRPLAAWRLELLDLAFDAASAFPANPHAKNRSRAQESVAIASLELGLPQRARSYADRVSDWRRGFIYARLALHCADQGARAEALECAEIAQCVADAPRGDDAQAWQRDRIVVTVARARLLLEDERQALDAVAGAVDSEAAALHAARAAHLATEDFDARFAEIEAALASASFDQALGLLEAGAALFERFYADPERRARAEDLVKRGWSRLPLQARIELVTGLAEAALRSGDSAATRRLADDSLALLEGAAWKPEDRIALGAPLIVLRHGGGDALRAAAEAGNLLAFYNESRERIVNMDRADALRAVAEAFAEIGDSAGALAAYRRAAEEGMENPNARPRADDLVATCLAMAASAVEPDVRLAERLHEIRAALRDPW